MNAASMNCELQGSPASISAPAEEYLEAMCRIRDRGETPTASTLARELHVAPPSVVGMLKRMADQGLILYARQTGITLTVRGEHCAARLRRRHRLAERLLTDLLGMPWARAHALACRFEHVIDDEIEPYLLAALHHPTTCPHGNPITEDAVHHATLRLPALPQGTMARLVQVLDESDELLAYLEQLRIAPGVCMTVLEVAPFDGPFLIEVDGVRHALARAVADHLLVLDAHHQAPAPVASARDERNEGADNGSCY